jgi:hypothetical protein
MKLRTPLLFCFLMPKALNKILQLTSEFMASVRSQNECHNFSHQNNEETVKYEFAHISVHDRHSIC